MKLITTLSLIASAAFPGALFAQGPAGENEGAQVSIGLGLMSTPSYMGNDASQLSLFPDVSFNYGERFTASFRGIRYTAIKTDAWKIGPVVSYEFGREEDSDGGPFAISGGATRDLIGLGDIDGTLTLGAFVEYEAKSFAAKAEVHQGIDGGHDGIKGEASISYRTRIMALGPPVFFSIGPAVSFSDDAYASTFFDVSTSQSAASGISQFDANGGLNAIGLHTSAMMPLSKSVSIIGLLKYDQLTGDIESSSLVTERGSKDQVTSGIIFNYRF